MLRDLTFVTKFSGVCDIAALVCVVKSELTSIGNQSLSVLFYTVQLVFSPWFTKYFDAETVPELQPDLIDLRSSLSVSAREQLLNLAHVPTAVRHVDTFGVFIEELLLQSHLEQLNNSLSLRVQGSQVLTSADVVQLLDNNNNK